MKKLSKILIVFLLLFIPILTGEAFSVGDSKSFFVESLYDDYSRNEVPATLINVTNETLVYIESDWWESLSEAKRASLSSRIYEAVTEFERKFYPRMTSLFGPTPDHPVDKSQRLTILFHQMPTQSGGYFSSGDQYELIRFPRSNERNMVYINSLYAESESLEGFLAHEFMHLLTFNAKNRVHRVNEETWLNEARAEYVPTLFSYSEELPKRIRAFLNAPEKSLVNWDGSNYGIVNLFTHYLVDHYGIDILSDSLKSEKVGIESLNEALSKNGYSESFADIFTDWTIAVLVNDCSLGEKYCYLNPDMKEIRIVPSTNLLSTSYGSSYSSRRSFSQWSATWQRVLGGKGDLLIEFDGDANYRIPYLFCKGDSCILDFVELNEENEGSLLLKGFGDEVSSVTFIPSFQPEEDSRDTILGWKVLAHNSEEGLIDSLLKQIALLQAEVARLRALIGERSCTISKNLSLGDRGDEVSCLQEFLKKQGGDIYPEGLVTGNFLSLTKSAVIRFQEKYVSEVLTPFGLSSGTGYVGELTRKKINQLLGQ